MKAATRKGFPNREPNSELAMYEEVGNASQSSFYTDVTQAGGLGPAIQAQLTAIGSPLSVRKVDSEFARLFPFACERVEQKQRFSQIMIAKHKRLFMLDFWDRGICLAHGSTPLLSKLAEAIHAWVSEVVSTGELRRRFPFVGVEPTAESHEQGAAAEVERKWQALHSHVKSDKYQVALAPLVEKAMEVPVLRNLFPFTSLSSLCFSRCTGYPFSGDCPTAWPIGKGRFQVTDSNGQLVGEGKVQEAVQWIVQHLPPNCGPAIQGTVDDLP